MDEQVIDYNEIENKLFKSIMSAMLKLAGRKNNRKNRALFKIRARNSTRKVYSSYIGREYMGGVITGFEMGADQMSYVVKIQLPEISKMYFEGINLEL